MQTFMNGSQTDGVLRRNERWARRSVSWDFDGR
jgi:hypothetical protein